MNELSYKIILVGLIAFVISQYVTIWGYETEITRLMIEMDNILDICL